MEKSLDDKIVSVHFTNKFCLYLGVFRFRRDRTRIVANAVSFPNTASAD